MYAFEIQNLVTEFCHAANSMLEDITQESLTDMGAVGISATTEFKALPFNFDESKAQCSLSISAQYILYLDGQPITGADITAQAPFEALEYTAFKELYITSFLCEFTRLLWQELDRQINSTSNFSMN